jgi:Carboxypeptidase regulatory-like domain
MSLSEMIKSHIYSNGGIAMRITAICLLLLASGLWASAAALEGIVRAPDGHPMKNAHVRIEAKNAKFVKTTTTDAKGHYFCDGLSTGTDYKVTLVVNGLVKASIDNTRVENARAFAGKSTELNFELSQAKGSPKKHRIWVTQETGTHIGSSGHWVEVDENGRVVNDNADLVKTGSDYARQLQLSGGNRQALPGQ